MLFIALLLAAQATTAAPSPAAAAAPSPTVPATTAAPPPAAAAFPVVPTEPPAAATAQFRHVVVVSVDGLRPDAIDPRPEGRTPAIARMMRGSGTLNARTDPEITVTLPNHIGMVTGRMMGGAVGHGWKLNDDRFFTKGDDTLHSKAGRYIAGMFDVAHDAGVATAMFASKLKFWLFPLSYDGSADAEYPAKPVHPRRTLELFVYAPRAADLSAQAAAWLGQRSGRSLAFVHFSDPDNQGHATGWVVEDGSPYLDAVARADAALGSLLAAVDSSERLRGTTAIILTTDHGGGAPLLSHTVPWSPLNFRIPFLVWLGHDTPTQDLAALNRDTRAQPALDEHVDGDAPLQPIRNMEAGNLALQLLGLPPIPGSTCNAAQNLRVTAGAGSAPAPQVGGSGPAHSAPESAPAPSSAPTPGSASTPAPSSTPAPASAPTPGSTPAPASAPPPDPGAPLRSGSAAAPAQPVHPVPAGAPS